MSVITRAVILSAVFVAGCARPDSEIPEWLARVITQQESGPVANPPAVITRYEYKGQIVYYLPPRCCDVPSTVYSATGAVMCSADGGMTGGGDGRCPDFFEQRKAEKVVWSDKRSR